MPRRMAGRAALAAIILSVVLITSGCASSTPPAPTALPPGMTNVLIAHCLEEYPVDGGTVLRIDQDGWLASFDGTTYTDKPRSDHITTTAPGTAVPAQSSTTPNESTSLGALDSFGVCMTAFRIDYSLVYTDGVAQRARLYDYYTAQLVPCLARFGWHTTPPDRLTFAATPYGGWDPYLAVATSNVDLARHVSAICPPAPPGMLAAARVIATARGATPIR